jgi:hypothetical protein
MGALPSSRITNKKAIAMGLALGLAAFLIIVGLARFRSAEPQIVQYTPTTNGVGVVDIGSSQHGVPYSYETTSFLGNASIQSLAGNDSLSIQLNLFLMVSIDNTRQYYWVQDVAGFVLTSNSRTCQLYYESSIYNVTSRNAGLNSSLLSGKGSIIEWQQGFYYTYLTTRQQIQLPYNLTISMNASRNLNGEPVVDFSYSSGLQKVVFNTVTFLMESNSSSFYVSGSHGAIYDAEFVLTDVGGGGTVALFSPTTVDLSLLCLNQTTQTYLSVPHALNYGIYTAEKIINYDTLTQGRTVEITSGNGTKEILW